MEIHQGIGGHGRSQRPKTAPQQPARSAPQEGAARVSHAPLAAPVPVISQPLALPLTGRVTPRARPAGLEAAEGYGAARKAFDK